MKNKNDILFLVASTFLIIVGIIFMAYAIDFLAVKINSALNISASGNQKYVRINFEGLKKIGIIKE